MKLCSVCGMEMVGCSRKAKMHLECVGEHNRRKREERQPLPEYHDAAKLAAYTATLPPAMREPVGRPIEDLRNNRRLDDAKREAKGLSPLRVAVLDIETSGLNAGFGVVLCAVIKTYGPTERFVLRADQYDAWKRGERANDRDLLCDILAVLEDCDVVVAHNGVNFDLPFLRTRAVIHGLPPVNFNKIIDPVRLARQHFRFPGNSLDSISNVIGTKEKKTPLTPLTWARACMNGDADAMNEIVEHCIYDVDVLEEVCYAIRGYVRKIDSNGSFFS